jgi:formylglycine-generating enzyme
MNLLARHLLCALASIAWVAPAHAAEARGVPPDMVLIPAGLYRPLLRDKNDPPAVPVAAFLLDERPVTNAEFLTFVRDQPKWRRSRVSRLFADEVYLSTWAGDLAPGPAAPADAPVVNVSWFAARAYAAWRGARLPTVAEWERAAAAGYATDDGMKQEPEFRTAVFAWLARPTPDPLPAVGHGRPNRYGVRDLLGLVWEWTDDFNTAMVTGESRADTGLERNLFCGAGAVSATDKENYPAFIRTGFRSSLRANYAVPNLGFRCARDLAARAPPNP